jgi:hypothetical protein
MRPMSTESSIGSAIWCRSTRDRFYQNFSEFFFLICRTSFHSKTEEKNLFEYYVQKCWIFRYFKATKGQNYKLKFDQIWSCP